MIWIVSAWVRREREHCCDSAVVAHTCRPRVYAQLLLALSEQVSRNPLAKLPPAAPQVVSSMAQHPLVARIRRILKKEEQSMQVSRKILALVLASFAGVALAIGGYCSQASRAADAPPAAKPSDNATTPVETPWGKPTEGFVARVRADKTVWPANEVPEFQVDVKNSGKTTGYVFRYQGGCEVEIDGVAYYCAGVFYGEHIDFPPGREYLSIPLVPAKVWYSVKDRDPRATMKGYFNGANAKAWAYPVTDNDNTPLKGTPLRLSPGKHTLRAVYIVDLDKDPVKGRSIRAVSNTIEFEVQKPVAGQQPGPAQQRYLQLGVASVGAAANLAEMPWGKPTEGFVARVRADKTVSPADWVPGFRVDIKNSGQATGFFVPQEDFELEIDGVAYRWGGEIKLGVAPEFRPGQEYPDIPLTLGNLWHNSDGTPLTLAPGKHTLQVVCEVQVSTHPWPKTRVVSNAIEFEIPPVALPKVDDHRGD